MNKIKQHSDGHYYEKIVTWKGKYDYKNLLFGLIYFNLIMSFFTFIIIIDSKEPRLSLFFLVIMFLVNLLLPILELLVDFERKVTYRRVK